MSTGTALGLLVIGLVVLGTTTLGVAALISWLVTALFGLFLVAIWLIENDVTYRGATASRLPAPVIFGHVLLALTGLVFWVVYLLSGSATAGWTAVGFLGGIALLGLTMFTRWIPVHRSYVAAQAKAGTLTEYEFPAERAFPVPAVAGHGLLAGATLTLVLLTMLAR